MKLDPGGAIVWSTLLFGTNGSAVYSLSIDKSGNVWSTGTTGAAIPLASQTPASINGRFVAELSPDGSDLSYATIFAPGGAGQSIAVDSSGVAHVLGTDLVSTVTPGSSTSRVVSIINAAPRTIVDFTGHLNGIAVPGEIISIFGSGMGPLTAVGATPENGRFPVSLGGVQVLVNGSPIPLLYVSDTQINAELPSSLKPDPSGLAVIEIDYNDAVLPAFRAAVGASNFGVFENPGGAGSTVVVNQDGTISSPANPAKPGSYVSMYGTGFGSVPGFVIDGSVATAAKNYCGTCQVEVFGAGLKVFENVQYFGPSPGLIDGLTQINLFVPPQASGAIQVYLIAPNLAGPQLLGFVFLN
jgi:uncharacterized protein (TIGR03437 family)